MPISASSLDNYMPTLASIITTCSHSASIVTLTATIYSFDINCHTPNFWLACAAPRNPVGQPSQCLTFSQTQDIRGSPLLVFYLLLKYKTLVQRLPHSRDAQCSLWIQFSIIKSSGHACLLYRLLKGSPNTNLTKSPTLTLSLQPQANANPSQTKSLA